MHVRIPSYRLHRPSGQAVVTLSGKDHYLGRHGSSESRVTYERLLAEWLVNDRSRSSPEPPKSDLTINELLLVYWDHVQSYYVKDGKPTSEPGTIRQALRPVRELYGDTPAMGFGPLSLKAVRRAMVGDGNGAETGRRRLGCSASIEPSTVSRGARLNRTGGSLQERLRGRSPGRESRLCRHAEPPAIAASKDARTFLHN
jgi:hypothetical protein